MTNKNIHQIFLFCAVFALSCSPPAELVVLSSEYNTRSQINYSMEIIKPDSGIQHSLQIIEPTDSIRYSMNRIEAP